MTEEIKRQLWEWAAAYHCAGFIQNDPVQFPHRYERKQDIEISGLLTAIMSFGNRKQILKKADELHRLMGVSPHQYVLSCRWKNDFPATDRSCFYRMLSYADFHSYFRRLHAAYSAFDSLEDALCTYAGNPMERLCAFLEVSAKSPQKKLNMFLRYLTLSRHHSHSHQFYPVHFLHRSKKSMPVIPQNEAHLTNYNTTN